MSSSPKPILQVFSQICQIQFPHYFIIKNRINRCSSTFFLGKLSKTLLVHFSPSKRTLWPECHQNLYFVSNKRINTSVLFCPQLHFVQTAADMMIVNTKQRIQTHWHTLKNMKSQHQRECLCMVETIEIILILYTARTHHSSKRMVPQKTWVLENFGTISKSEKQLWSISKSHFQVILCLEVLNFFKSQSWILKLGSHSLVKSQIYILRTFLHTVFPEKNAQACI